MNGYKTDPTAKTALPVFSAANFDEAVALVTPFGKLKILTAFNDGMRLYARFVWADFDGREESLDGVTETLAREYERMHADDTRTDRARPGRTGQAQGV